MENINKDGPTALETCVDEFAAEMKKQLILKLREGKRGWDDPTEC